MTAKVIKESCPKCDRVHTRGQLMKQIIGEQVFISANDVKCPCGLDLRWSVPIFKMSESGFILRVRRDSEVPYASSVRYED